MRMAGFIMITTALTLGALAAGGPLSVASAADVRFGVNIGVPPPVVVAPAPPVYVEPSAPAYFYGDSYYTYYNGAWFAGPHHGGPWTHYGGPPPWERHPRERHWREGHVRGGKHWDRD